MQTTGTMPRLYDNTTPRRSAPRPHPERRIPMAGKKCEYTMKGGKGGKK